MHTVELCGDVPIDRVVEQAVKDYGGVDWEQLEILETVDEDGERVQDIIDEDRLFCLLGLRTNEEQNEGEGRVRRSLSLRVLEIGTVWVEIGMATML